MPGQRQPLACALHRDELRDHRSVLYLQRQRRAEPKRIRTGRGERTIRRWLDPRLDRTVIRTHRNATSQPLHDPHHARRPLSSARHEINQPDRALGGFEVGLKHQRSGPGAPRVGPNLTGRRDEPAPVPIIPEQRREARGGIEAGEAEPVDRAVSPYKSGGLQIADQAIVLKKHQLPPSYGCGRTCTTTVPASMSCTPRRRLSRRIGTKPANSGSAASIRPRNLSTAAPGPGAAPSTARQTRIWKRRLPGVWPATDQNTTKYPTSQSP